MNSSNNTSQNDELAIRALSDRYTDALNRRDFVTMRNCYTDDAVWESSAPIENRLEGVDAIMRFNEEVISGMDMLMQLTFAPVIDINGDRAQTRWSVMECGRSKNGKSGMMNFGLYLSDVRRQLGGHWLFTRRLYHVLYRDQTIPAGMAFAPPIV